MDQTAQPPSPPRSSHIARTLRILLSWVVAIAVAIFIQQFAIQSYRVFGQSMEPALQESDFLIVSKLGPAIAQLRNNEYVPERGDIVVMESPLSDTRLIKRTIGLPGEQVIVRNGTVTITNQKQPDGFDPYQQLGLEPQFAAGSINLVVPEGHIFVIGDNRQPGGSSDSRNEIGPVDTDNVIGRAVLRLWPFDEIQTF